MPIKNTSRREFIKVATSSAVAATTVTGISQPVAGATETERISFSPNDQLQIATVGVGIRGFIITREAVDIPGVKLVAAADCYDARLARVKEVFGDEVFTSRDYREILERSDVDAVLIATSDHWHAQIAVDAMKAGKDVYCEKPMTQTIEGGRRVIQAQKETGRVLQVGSGAGSSTVNDLAGNLFRQGVIGELTKVEMWRSRNSAIGAWQYSIPPNASPKTIDWERFLGDAPSRTFDADRFFRWRKYWDYGTGIPGDLFVHQFTKLHDILQTEGPDQIVATGGLRYWKEKREVPDEMTGLYLYPETEQHPDFTLSLTLNFTDGHTGRGFRMIGRQGMMTVSGGQVVVTRSVSAGPTLQSLVDGYNSVRTFSEEVQQEFIEAYRATHSESSRATYAESGETVYEAAGSSDSHMKNFVDAIREDEPVVEDAAFGLRAAAPALLSNKSYLENRFYGWDPHAMKVIS